MPDKKNSNNNKHVNIYNKHILNTEKAKERERKSEGEKRKREEKYQFEMVAFTSKWKRKWVNLITLDVMKWYHVRPALHFSLPPYRGTIWYCIYLFALIEKQKNESECALNANRTVKSTEFELNPVCLAERNRTIFKIGNEISREKIRMKQQK